MARYQYRHSIDFDADPALDDRGRAILKAAFAVAKRAHAGQSRLKRNKSIQYISHPIMVYDIMRKLGETDPEVLAAAILHDAIEDHSVFKANDIEMGDALSKALFAKDIEEVSDVPQDRAVEEEDRIGENHAIVDSIIALCREVTNPKLMDGDGIKENYQHDRIKGMSFNAKKIKIADQAASLICNLTMPNDPAKFTPEKEIAFTEKAHTLGVGIVESVEGNVAEREALKPYASFFGKTLLNVYPLVGTNDTKQKKQLRRGFDFDMLFEKEPYVSILPPKTTAVERLPLANDTKKTGVASVDFDRDGNVIRYAVWTAWDEPKGEANTMQKQLTEQIRAMRRIGGQYTEGKHGGDPLRTVLLPKSLDAIEDSAGKRLEGIARVFELSPPLNPMAFAAAAKALGAVDKIGWNAIRDKGAQVKQTHEEMENQPVHYRINSTNIGPRWHD